MPNASNLLYTMLVAVLFTSCDKIFPKYESRQYEVVIEKKYAENESTNNFGSFRTNHYFLYTNGELEVVELKDYITYEVGDTLLKTEHYRAD